MMNSGKMTGMEEQVKTIQVKTDTLIQLLELSEAILNGDYSKRVVADFSDDLINRVITNLNQHADALMLNPPEIKDQKKVNIRHFIVTISSFANHNFSHKLPISGHATIMDAIATAINMLGDELEQSVASKIELDRSFHLVTEQNQRLLNFSYIVSHNLRSHTGNIQSLLTLLETTVSEEEKKEIMSHMKTVSDSLNETIVHLHNIVSIQKNINLNIEPLNLSGYINKAVDVLGIQVSSKKAIIKNMVPEDLTVNYNPAYLESILLNFLSNAIKYSHPDRQPVVLLDSFEAGSQLVLQITDNGLGIDLKRFGDKLFGMYKTFHGNPDARGIGLFITRNQIETMGGKVEVESEIDKGTRFKIYFK